MPNDFFKVTRGVCDGSRFVEVLRPFAESDFTFEARVTRHASMPHPPADPGTASVHVQVEARPSKAALEAIKETFPVSGLNCRHDRYDREKVEMLNGGLVRTSDGRRVDYRGASGAEARRRRNEKQLPEFEAELQARIPALKVKAVDMVNGMVIQLIARGNDDCVRGDVQAMTREPWEWLDEQAGVADKSARIKELRDEVSRLRGEIQRARNEACLKALRDDGWTVTVGGDKFALCGESRRQVEEVLGKGEGFQPDPMRR